MRCKKTTPMRFVQAIVLSAFVSSTGFCELPKDGVLLNKDAAIKVAEILLVQIYGEQVLSQRPFQAKPVEGYWIIDGTFHCPKGDHCLGGVAHIEMSQKDGQVRNVIHGK